MFLSFIPLFFYFKTKTWCYYINISIVNLLEIKKIYLLLASALETHKLVSQLEAKLNTAIVLKNQSESVICSFTFYEYLLFK